MISASIGQRRRRRSAPILGSQIGDGLREGPAVPSQILRRVLALPIGVVPRRTKNSRSVLPCAVVVSIDIVDFDQYRVAVRLIARVPRGRVSPVNGRLCHRPLSAEATTGWA